MHTSLGQFAAVACKLLLDLTRVLACVNFYLTSHASYRASCGLTSRAFYCASNLCATHRHTHIQVNYTRSQSASLQVDRYRRLHNQRRLLKDSSSESLPEHTRTTHTRTSHNTSSRAVTFPTQFSIFQIGPWPTCLSCSGNKNRVITGQVMLY